jgi:hypothetical protein
MLIFCSLNTSVAVAVHAIRPDRTCDCFDPFIRETNHNG